MKWFIVAFAMVLSSAAIAADQCEADCAEVGKRCGDTCKKALKKDQADKIGFCKDKCKEFESDCKKDCKSESPKR